jgi:small subunit ribosomal protein S7
MIVNNFMRCGKKTCSYRILYAVLEEIREKARSEPLAIFEHSIRIVTPKVQLKSRRVRGTTYQVPIEIREQYGVTIAIKWILTAARANHGLNIITQLSIEILDAARGNGGAIRKREEVQRIAESNKAFARYRFLTKIRFYTTQRLTHMYHIRIFEATTIKIH